MTLMKLVAVPVFLLSVPELLSAGAPLKLLKPLSPRRFSVPPLLITDVPFMAMLEPTLNVPFTLRIRELMMGNAPAGMAAIDDVLKVRIPGPLNCPPVQVTLPLAVSPGPAG